MNVAQFPVLADMGMYVSDCSGSQEG